MQFDPSTEVIENCLLCGETDTREDKWFARKLGLTDPYGVVQCKHCGLRWLSPRPTAIAYRDIYTHENYFETKGPLDSYAPLAESRRPYFRSRIQAISKCFEPRPLRVLDVGAATGEFVDEARHAGHQAEGIELSSSAREEAMTKLGISLSGANVDELSERSAYDVIHMNHVLEHMPNPLTTLHSCRRLLKPRGLLVVEVPQQILNDLDRLKRVLPGARTPSFTTYSLHHTYFFTPATLARLLAAAGFEIQHIATSNPARTPLKPLRIKNLFLRIFLWATDRLRSGGNIIEVYSRPATSGLRAAGPNE